MSRCGFGKLGLKPESLHLLTQLARWRSSSEAAALGFRALGQPDSQLGFSDRLGRCLKRLPRSSNCLDLGHVAMLSLCGFLVTLFLSKTEGDEIRLQRRLRTPEALLAAHTHLHHGRTWVLRHTEQLNVQLLYM